MCTTATLIQIHKYIHIFTQYWKSIHVIHDDCDRKKILSKSKKLCLPGWLNLSMRQSNFIFILKMQATNTNVLLLKGTCMQNPRPKIQYQALNKVVCNRHLGESFHPHLLQTFQNSTKVIFFPYIIAMNLSLSSWYNTRESKICHHHNDFVHQKIVLHLLNWVVSLYKSHKMSYSKKNGFISVCWKSPNWRSCFK